MPGDRILPFIATTYSEPLKIFCDVSNGLSVANNTTGIDILYIDYIDGIFSPIPLYVFTFDS